MSDPQAGELTSRQREVLLVVERYTDVTGEPCPSTIIARRLALSTNTVRQHLGALHRKGWLSGPGSPAAPRR